MQFWQKFKNPHTPIQTGQQLLKSMKETYVRSLFHLSGVSPETFDAYYVSALSQFSELVQSLPASEVHHHAHHQGLLIHSLEVAIYALKIRQSYILPKGKPIEQADKEKDTWNYALFTAALLHDVGKPIIDQEVQLFRKRRLIGLWNPWHLPMTQTQATHYCSRYNPQRDYELHKRLGLAVFNRIIPVNGINWMAQNKPLMKSWLAALSNDLGLAEEIGEIVQKADQQSVGLSLGATPTIKRTQSVTIPLEQRCLTTLRYLLEEKWTLNTSGAVGWYTEEALWLAAPRFVTEMRAHMIKEGHKGLPERNTRYYDLFAEHQFIENGSDGKSVIKATLQLGDWQQTLTLLKFKPAMIWENRERPPVFEGEIHRVIEAEDVIVEQGMSEPSLISDQAELDGVMELEAGPPAERHPITQTHLNQHVGHRFLEWLKNGISTYQLKINEQDAMVHVVEEGVLLTTPKIFQHFSTIDQVKDFSSVQKGFQKLGLYRKGPQKNFFRVEVRTDRKVSEFNAYLIPDVMKIIGDQEIGPNRHLKLIDA